jgi:hypothetical protein
MINPVCSHILLNYGLVCATNAASAEPKRTWERYGGMRKYYARLRQHSVRLRVAGLVLDYLLLEQTYQHIRTENAPK